MFDRIMAFLAGIGVIWLGVDTITTGGHYVRGYHSDYGNFKIPIGVFFIICGVVFIIFSFWKKKNKAK